jgi:hypothetical protein
MRAVLDSAMLANPTSDAETLFREGIGFVRAGDSLATLIAARSESLGRDTAALRTMASALSAGANEARDLAAGKCASTGARVETVADAYEQLSVRATAALQSARTYRASVNRLRTATGLVQSILSSPNNFWELRQLGDYDSASVATIEIKRVDGAIPESDRRATNLGSQIFRFGSPRALALAFGPAAMMGIPHRTFDRAESPADDGKAVISTIAVEKEERIAVPLLMMVHLRIHERVPVATSLHVSLGTNMLSEDDSQTRIWFPGLSLGLRDERMFITCGLNIGEKRSLSGGYQVGQQVPDSLNRLLKNRS